MFHRLEDRRVSCLSIMTEMRVADYLDLVNRVYDKSGGIEGQRAPLKTKTALTIRHRLVSDLIDGAIIPPIVLGYLASSQELAAFRSADGFDQISRSLADVDEGKVSIIDGMQRTTALLDARNRDPSIAERLVRVELWVAEKVNSLIYRMLVLNTGQVPWDISRQLETIYGQFIKQIQDALQGHIEIFKLEDNRRRWQAAQYQSKSVVELLLIFSSRKIEVDIKEKVSEDFARLDAIEASANMTFLDQFILALKLLSNLDRAFSRLDPTGQPNQEGKRVRYGRDIFASFPAMAGFCAALAIHAFDEPGFEIQWEEVPKRMHTAEAAVNSLTRRLDQIVSIDEFKDFLQLALLEEKLSQRSGQVGRFEREFFRRAFAALIKNSDRLSSMAPCWMAH